jgi:hypothetical protein
MPYFRRGKILLIHIPKTGGTSVEDYLMKIYRAKKNAFNLFKIVDSTGIKHPLQHCTINELKDNPNIEIDWNNVKIITIVRNPYHRAVSALFWRDAININSTKEEIEDNIDIFLQTNYDFDNHNWPQYKFLEHNGEIDSNIIILKTESLTEDMHKNGFRKFNVNNNVSYRNKIDYMALLSDSAKRKLYEFYKKDFELFGYDPEFDSTNDQA